jgi:hypothetical protein
LLERRRGAAVLCCNLLGQVQLEQPDEQQRRFQVEFVRRILPALADRRWASFHDRWSLDRDAAEPKPTTAHFPRRPSDEELAATWFGSTGVPITAFEHQASALFPETWPRRYFSWQLTPRALHVVEGVAGIP